jgi:CO/xanthine dehydrogenase Mo-binding subunit
MALVERPEMKVIGKLENPDKLAYHVVTGNADFASDRLAGRKLYGAIKCSTIMKGVITKIDATKALAEPGVKAVVTHEDVPSWKEGIFFWGQPVAGVIADDPYIAERACNLIEVEYEDRPGVFDPDEAMQAGAPLSGIRPDSNINLATDLTRGDPDGAIASAPVQLETIQGYTTTYQHATLEPHQSVAWWVGEDLYVWIPSQHIHGAKNSVVNAFGMPANKVHLFTHFTGCGHGDKTGDNTAIVSAAMSRKVNGAPVNLIKTRQKSMLTHSWQFAVKSTIKWGATQDGKILGVDAKFYGDGGSNAMAPIGNCHFGLRTTYDIPDARFQVTVINTNSPSRAYWRCVNDPPGACNYDSALYKLAAHLDMDPYQLIMKNLRANDAPDLDAPYYVWGGIAVKEMFEWLYTETGYASKWHKPGEGNVMDDGRLHGIAITGHRDSHGSVNGASRGGIVTMCPDGTALVNVGGARGPSGGPMICVHIVAETLGMKYEDVGLGDWGATDTTLDAGIQAGSGFTGGAGSGFLNAALDLRGKLFSYAIQKAGLRDIEGITVDDLDAENSEVFYKKDPTKRITYRQVMSGTPPLAGSGFGWASHTKNRAVGNVPMGERCNSNGNACSAAEVAVDIETGEVEILGHWNAVDTGRTIFKQGTIKEMRSGSELQIWQALYSGSIWDKASGACLSSNYTEAMMPTSMCFKGENLHQQDFESYDAAGPYGAHGIGEPCVTNYSSIICAVFNATGKWVDLDKGPCTPDKVLKALGKA